MLRFEPALCIDGRCAPHTRSGHRLAIDWVSHITSGKDAFNIRVRAWRVHVEIAHIVHVELVLKNISVRLMPNSTEVPSDLFNAGLSGLAVTETNAGDAITVSEYLFNDRVPDELDLLILHRPLLHDLARTKRVAAMDYVDTRGELSEEVSFLHRGVSSANHHQLLVAEEETVAGRTGADATSEIFLLSWNPKILRGCAGRDDDAVGRVHGAIVLPDAERALCEIDALNHLRHNKHEVVVFHVLDKSTEVAFDFPERPTRFVDLETGEELKLHPSEVRDHYISRMGALRKELSTRCGAHGIDWVDVDIAEGPVPVLARYLIKRKKLF